MTYQWVDKTTGTEVEVERKMSDYEQIPTKEESGMSDIDYNKADWERVVTGGSCTIGFGLKGHW